MCAKANLSTAFLPDFVNKLQLKLQCGLKPILNITLDQLLRSLVFLPVLQVVKENFIKFLTSLVQRTS